MDAEMDSVITNTGVSGSTLMKQEGSRGCSGKLCTNLDATEVIRTGEHAEGCRVDAYAFYHQQQLNELKRLAAGDPRPVLEIYDELASNASTSLETAADTHHFQPGGRICSLLPSRQQRNLDGVRLLAQSNCWCGDGTFKIVPSWYQQLFTLHVFLRRKLLPVVYCLTVRKDLPTPDHDFSRQLSQHPGAGLFLPLLLSCASAAFLPVHLAPAGFEIINVGKSGQLEALYQYFQQEWLPATKIKLWNVHGVSMRTNNHLEDEQGKTKTVVRQIDDGYTHGRGSVRRSAAYGVQQRRVAALTGKFVHNEITVEHFLIEISYHTPEPLRL
ncbi:hypothetical protein T05_9331 [Trichinella murrelli]|uniref:Uncharacterized protein n=1 Tax=Trichinella murrelli TaxID=144512 RepID=A0A0V0T3G2_9BILA|nr:hypothetical protein T05_9331 [Trichinella murrelli]